MGGQSVEVTVNDLAIVVVPVYRMFAKMEINVKVSLEGLVESSSVEAEPVTLDVGSVPNVCYVGSLYTGDDSKAAEYPFNVEFLPHTFSMTPSVDDPDYVYVLYVPENIQGEVENPDPDTVSKSDIAPADATMVTTHLSLTTEVEGEKVSIKADPQYTVYPGGNITDNFNIRRNCVYRVNVTIYPDDVVSPCANCLVASVGEFFAFYPYERDEVGHRDDAADKGDDNEGYSYYDIQNHIYPYEKGDEYYDTSKNYTGKQIKGVKIIWQTENAIGNNTNKNLVWVENGNSQRCRIYVRANQVGNALIGAYSDADCTGDILWSWHIWITDFNPDNVDNALTYYHYKWDENGINTDNNQREEGYPLMICNLGALATDVTGDSPSWDNYTKTYGLLYQWGRKDPFPPAKYNGNGSGSYPNGKTHKMYNYDEATANVVVYDNNHNKITMTNNTGTAYATSGNSVFNTVLATTGYSTNADGIDYSIKHPTTFLAAADFGGDTSGALDDASGSYYNNTNYYYNQGDWLPVGDNDLWGGNGTFGVVASEKHLSILTYANDGVEANLEDNYGKYKTIFDPCPYGWRISPGDLWLGMTSDGKNYNYGNTGLDMYENVNCEETTAAKVADHMGFHMYLEKWHQGKTSFFPTQGSRLANGRPYLGGVCGNYHNATVDEVVTVKNYGGAKVENAIRRVDIIHFHADASSPVKTQVQPFETQLCYYCRAVAGPVRCVRDTQK